MITIYHNPRCAKSRQGLAVLESSGKKFEIIKYLETHPTIEELSQLIKKLAIEPINLVRKNEVVWRENYKKQSLTDNQILSALSENPKLIERPIVIVGKKAVIGRPKERIIELLNN